MSRLVWAEVLRTYARDLDRSGDLIASVADEAPGGYPVDEVVLAKQRGSIDRLEQLALDERLPFPARLEAAGALADRAPKAQAERVLRRLARERPADVETHERLIRFLHDAGRPADALATALDLLRTLGDDDSFRAASARCAAARQLDAMGRHEDALTMIERALPTEAVCTYRIATVQLARLGRKEDAEGLLLVNGPNRMLGYLDEPEKTSEVVRDGWYVTGDIAMMDEAGFIRITDRLSRFSKIAGEMVPHMKIEDQMRTLIDEHHACVVTAVPDPSKGERLVAFYTDAALAPQDLWERLCRTDLPKLWIPKRDDLHVVEAIPTLGTGKTDLRAVRQLALDHSGVPASR